MAFEDVLRRVQDEQADQRRRFEEHQADTRREFSAMRADLRAAVEGVGLKIDRWAERVDELYTVKDFEAGKKVGIAEAKAPSPTKLAIIQGAAGQLAGTVAAAAVAVSGALWAHDHMDGGRHHSSSSTTTTSSTSSVNGTGVAGGTK